MSKAWAVVGLVIGLAGLVLQFWLTIPSSMESGRNLLMSLVFFFSFFTIQTNIILVLVYLGVLFDGPWLVLFEKPQTRVMAAALITLVMVFYHFILASVWAPEGLWKVADVLLHYVTPLFYLIWFAVLRYSCAVKFSAIPKMLIYPLLYVAYVLVRGAVTGEYPYAIFDANTLGYALVARNCVALLIGVSVLLVTAIFVDRIAPQNAENAETT